MGYGFSIHNPTENQSVGFFLTPKNTLPCQPRVNRFQLFWILVDTMKENCCQTPFIFSRRWHAKSTVRAPTATANECSFFYLSLWLKHRSPRDPLNFQLCHILDFILRKGNPWPTSFPRTSPTNSSTIASRPAQASLTKLSTKMASLAGFGIFGMRMEN